MICSNDDLAKCDNCKCKYNPVVVMATHNRIEITTINIGLLLKQNCKIILVVSNYDELDYYKNNFETDRIKVVSHSNHPLGAKWHYGVISAKDLNPNPLIIVGSDDILATNYIDRLLDYFNRGAGMVGATQWFTFDLEGDQLYKMKYINQNINFPIGSGKAFNKETLEKIKYKVFDSRLNKKLDDLGYHNARRAGIKIYLADDLKVLAVKGQWGEMNSVSSYLRSKNIRSEVVDKEILKQIFDYVPYSRFHKCS